MGRHTTYWGYLSQVDTPNRVYKVDHGFFAVAGGTGGSQTSLKVFGNRIHDFANWDDNADANHHDGIHISTGPPPMTGAYIYNNYIYGNAGQRCNALIYLGIGGPNWLSKTYIFNNVLVFGSTVNTCANGMIQDYGSTDTTMANNTMIGSSQTAGQGIECEEGSPAQPVVNNNIFMRLLNALYVSQNATMPLSDYNDFYDSANAAFVWGTNCCTTLSEWQSQTGSPDLHSITGNPTLNTSYIPQAGSAVIDYGTNLTSLGVTALDSDKAGNPRPSGTCFTQGSSSCWDMGAYDSASGGGAH